MTPVEYALETVRKFVVVGEGALENPLGRVLLSEEHADEGSFQAIRFCHGLCPGCSLGSHQAELAEITARSFEPPNPITIIDTRPKVTEPPSRVPYYKTFIRRAGLTASDMQNAFLECQGPVARYQRAPLSWLGRTTCGAIKQLEQGSPKRTFRIKM